ncbi:hypothetical protein IT418_03645 [bacterium]|nr:hypothetical protein [bacterium]
MSASRIQKIGVFLGDPDANGGIIEALEKEFPGATLNIYGPDRALEAMRFVVQVFLGKEKVDFFIHDSGGRQPVSFAKKQKGLQRLGVPLFLLGTGELSDLGIPVEGENMSEIAGKIRVKMGLPARNSGPEKE